MGLYLEDGTHPYGHETLPELSKLLVDLDWDVVCIYDAGRWDFYNTYFNPAEPVQSPGPATPHWIEDVILHPEIAWDDVAYVHANPQVELMNQGRYGDETYIGVVEQAVREYHPLIDSNDTKRDFLGNKRYDWFVDEYGPFNKTYVVGYHDPEIITEFARTQVEPPMIVHYTQPHVPMSGDSKITVQDIEDPKARELLNQTGVLDCPIEYDYAEKGHLSPAVLQLMYYHNYEMVMDCSEPLLHEYDRVIQTADHGEGVGPTSYRHNADRLGDVDHVRIIPFDLSWDADLDDPQAYGADPGYDWVHS